MTNMNHHGSPFYTPLSDQQEDFLRSVFEDLAIGDATTKQFLTNRHLYLDALLERYLDKRSDVELPELDRAIVKHRLEWDNAHFRTRIIMKHMNMTVQTTSNGKPFIRIKDLKRQQPLPDKAKCYFENPNGSHWMTDWNIKQMNFIIDEDNVDDELVTLQWVLQYGRSISEIKDVPRVVLRADVPLTSDQVTVYKQTNDDDPDYYLVLSGKKLVQLQATIQGIGNTSYDFFISGFVDTQHGNLMLNLFQRPQ